MSNHPYRTQSQFDDLTPVAPSVTTTTARTSWRERALCRRVDPDLFHPNPGEHTRRKQAQAVCAQCPVTGPCLQWALSVNEPNAICAGTTPGQRRAMLRRGA